MFNTQKHEKSPSIEVPTISTRLRSLARLPFFQKASKLNESDDDLDSSDNDHDQLSIPRSRSNHKKGSQHTLETPRTPIESYSKKPEGSNSNVQNQSTPLLKRLENLPFFSSPSKRSAAMSSVLSSPKVSSPKVSCSTQTDYVPQSAGPKRRKKNSRNRINTNTSMNNIDNSYNNTSGLDMTGVTIDGGNDHDNDNNNNNDAAADDDDDDVIILDYDPTADSRKNQPRRSRRQKRKQKSKDRYLRQRLENYKENTVIRRNNRIRSLRILPSDSEDDSMQKEDGQENVDVSNDKKQNGALSQESMSKANDKDKNNHEALSTKTPKSIRSSMVASQPPSQNQEKLPVGNQISDTHEKNENAPVIGLKDYSSQEPDKNHHKEGSSQSQPDNMNGYQGIINHNHRKLTAVKGNKKQLQKSKKKSTKRKQVESGNSQNSQSQKSRNSQTQNGVVEGVQSGGGNSQDVNLGYVSEGIFMSEEDENGPPISELIDSLRYSKRLRSSIRDGKTEVPSQANDSGSQEPKEVYSKAPNTSNDIALDTQNYTSQNLPIIYLSDDSEASHIVKDNNDNEKENASSQPLESVNLKSGRQSSIDDSDDTEYNHLGSTESEIPIDIESDSNDVIISSDNESPSKPFFQLGVNTNQNLVVPQSSEDESLFNQPSPIPKRTYGRSKRIRSMSRPQVQDSDHETEGIISESIIDSQDSTRSTQSFKTPRHQVLSQSNSQKAIKTKTPKSASQKTTSVSPLRKSARIASPVTIDDPIELESDPDNFDRSSSGSPLFVDSG